MLMYILFWILTIVFSVVSDFSLFFKMIRDLADDGYLYKLDSNRTQKNLNDYFSLALYLVPILNIMRSYINTNTYLNNQSIFMSSFNVLDKIEKMTPLEEEMYQENPTARTALFLKFKVMDRLLNAGCIIIKDNVGSNNEVGMVYFEYDSEKDDIRIIERKGCAKRYSDFAIKNFLKKANYHVTSNERLRINLNEIYANEEANNSQLKTDNDNTKDMEEPTIEHSTGDILQNSTDKVNTYVYKK